MPHPSLLTVARLLVAVALACAVSGCETDPVGPADPPDDANFEIGAHTTFVEDIPPADFAVLGTATAGHVPVVQGSQGLDMIVVGYRVRGSSLPGPVSSNVSLTVDGIDRGRSPSLQRNYSTVEGEWRGLYNIFLVLGDCDGWAEGASGELTVQLEDVTGSTFTRTVSVTVGAHEQCDG